MSKRATLIKPPKALPHYSPIESVLSLLPLTDIGPDIFTNQRPLWHPPGARGIFGGAAIAQCLSAAQATIPPDFTVHSMHCYFVLAGDSSIPILYHVERVRDGRSFITRTVQARQRGRPIFTTTLSFVRENSGGEKTVEHFVPMPTNISPPPPEGSRELVPSQSTSRKDDDDDDDAQEVPFDQIRLPITIRGEPHIKKGYAWIRARGRISDSPPGHSTTFGSQHTDNHQAHLSALAYMSDSYFIGTVARVHGIPRISNPKNIERLLDAFAGNAEEKQEMREYLERIAAEDAKELALTGIADDDRRISMMVSLDHTIYFHNPRSFRADEWMLAEVQSPWAGDGRGLVMQQIWSKDGILIASCIQEGVVRLDQSRQNKM
ncbi:hypothetical protein DV736_g6560, partial [Chaetothyriales sp. CBS 134916]